MQKLKTALFYCLSATVIIGCKQQDKQTTITEPQIEQIGVADIVDRAIQMHGGSSYEQAEISFRFRDFDYRSVQQGGSFTLDRISHNDAIGKITDRVTNDGYSHLLNNEFEMDIADSMKVKFTNSVNSVHYFARLPYGLKAPATQKRLLGEDSIAGKSYYEVEVRFKQEGGGVDFQDVFVYWFDKASGYMDYLAYSYETDGGGIRFRAAKNQREVKGIRFQDYVNYKPAGLDVELKDLDYLFELGKLIEVSKVELENIDVKILNDGI